MEKVAQIGDLVSLIAETNDYFQQQAQKQVNVALTLRNWLIGFYIFEYEQHGEDRAVYGDKLYKNLAIKLKDMGKNGLSFTYLHLCKQFYQIYPQIQSTLTVELRASIGKGIVQTLSEQFIEEELKQILIDEQNRIQA